MFRAGRFAAVAALALATGGCGYALVGRGSVLPSSIHSVAVPVFQNGTQRPGVEQWISEAVARELASRGSVSLASADEADAVLEGRVSSYNAWPSVLDSSGRASEYQIIVTAAVRLVSKQGTIILKVDDFRFQEGYSVSRGSAGGSGYSDLENQAVEALSSKLAESLVSALIEGF